MNILFSDLIIKKFQKNQLIFSEGELCQYLVIVLEGSISISTLTYNDQEYVITKIFKNDFFGENLLFGDKPYYLGDVISDSTSTLGYIDKQNILKQLSNNIELINHFLQQIANKNLIAHQRIKILSQKNIRDKIMFYLKTNDHFVRTKTEIAKILNIPRPSFMRELAKMQKENIIIVDGKKIKSVY